MVGISGLGGVVGNQQQQNIQKSNARLQAAIASLVSGSRLNKAADDVAALSTATLLQSEVSSLKQASGNLVQASSLAQVADGGAEQIQKALEEARSLAQQAGSPIINEQNRKALNEQLQNQIREINRLAENTTFNGNKLLNGDVSGDNALSIAGLIDGKSSDGEKLEIPDLSADALLDAPVDVSTPDNAKQAVASLGDALERVVRARADIGSFTQSLNFAAANIDTARINQEAARAILQDTDFAEASTESSLASIQRNAGLALAAQSNRLNPGLIKLLG